MRMIKVFSLFFVLWIYPGLAFTLGGSALSPDHALQQLVEGNKRFTKGKTLHPSQDASRRTQLTEGQHPVAAILGCSDSRVPPEIIFDQGLGDLFVVRLAGNTLDKLALGSLEYAASELQVPLILVLGHEKCGAVSATLKGKTLPGHIDDLAKEIRPALKNMQCGQEEKLDCAIHANVDHVVKELNSSSNILAPLIQEGKLKIVGGYYRLKDGAVELLSVK
jgi:carbonic anhydrase